MKVLWLEGFASCVTKSSQGLHIDTALVLLGPNASGERGGQVSAFRGEAGPPHSVTSKHRALESNGETEAFVSFEALAELSLPSLIVWGPDAARERGTLVHWGCVTLSPSNCRGNF